MQKIDAYLSKLPDWQQNHLALFRKLIHEVAPDIEEDWKWNVPFFMLDGKMLFAMSAFKAHTKYNFILNGAFLQDTDSLFNNGRDSQQSRSIDLREDEMIDEAKLKNLIKQSVDHALK
jgi:hypothetical protein